MAAGRGPARTGNGASPLAAVDRRRSRARCGFGVEGASGGGGRRRVRGRFNFSVKFRRNFGFFRFRKLPENEIPILFAIFRFQI